VTIWVVRCGDGLYLRSAYGSTSACFRATQERQGDRISPGGVGKDVCFVAAYASVSHQLDGGYHAKYCHYSARYVDPIVRVEAQAATIKIVPCLKSGATGG